ncbi:MAG: ArnT family glycosyltransferase [Bacteroidota bacterium]
MYRKRNVYGIAILGVLILFLISLFFRGYNMDEGVIAGHAYYLNKLGIVKSELYAGYGFGWEFRQYHYHKLFVLLGAGVIRVVGFALTNLRLISLFATAITAMFIIKLIKRIYKEDRYLIFLLFLVLFLFHHLVFTFSFYYRPETMVMCFGTLSFYWFYRWKKSHSDKISADLIISGVFTGLATLTHLNGLIFFIPPLFYLLYRRKFAYFIVYGSIAGVISLLYFWDINSVAEFERFSEQFFQDPNLIKKKAHFFLKGLEEHKRFFHSEKEAIFSVLLFMSLLLGGKENFKNNRFLLFYAGSLIFGLAFLSHGTTPKYGLLYLPLLVLLVVNSLYFIFKKKNKTSQYIMLVLVFLFFGIHSWRNIEQMATHYDLQERNKEIAEAIPERNVKVMAHETFVFDQIDNFTIRGPIAFHHHYKKFHPEEKITIEKFFSFSESNGNRYLIIDKKMDDSNFYVSSDGQELPEIIGQYKQIAAKDEFFVYQLKDSD